MPMIRLTVPTGALTEEGRAGIQRDLAALLLRWEGAPDTAFFRAQAWSHLIELPEGAQTTAEDDAPRFLVDVTVPQGALSERRKAGLVEDATKAVLKAAGLPGRGAAGVGPDPRAAGRHVGRRWIRHPVRRPGGPRPPEQGGAGQGGAGRCVN